MRPVSDGRKDKMKFNTQKYRQIELFIKTKPGTMGMLYMVSGGVKRTMRIMQEQKWMKLAVNPGSVYELTEEGCEIVFAYLSVCEQILERGICMLRGERLYEKAELEEWYDTPVRAQYHLTPLKGWMGIPGGLCRYRNYFHLFYQFDPFSEEGENGEKLYWGHAVSRDLIRWTHLPVCFGPQEAILKGGSLTGGVLGGHAYIDEERKLRLFFTRHISEKRNPKEMLDYQVMAESWDGLSFERETILLSGQETGENKKLRHPKVFSEKGGYRMLLGTQAEGRPAAALYKSSNLNHWKYEGIVFEEELGTDVSLEALEVFRLDGKSVMTADCIGYEDEYGRKNGTCFHIGEWHEGKFHAEKSGRFDFGDAFCGMQAIKTKDGRVAVGLLRDGRHENAKAETGVCGSLSLPRLLRIKEGRLYQNPLPQIYRMLGERLYEGRKKEVELANIPGNAYHVKMKLGKAADFRMTLFRWKGRKLYLEQKDGQTRFRTTGMGNKNTLLPADLNGAEEIEVFVDRYVCEVYLNRGEAAGTKLFLQQSGAGYFEMHLQEDAVLESLAVEKMESIWKENSLTGQGKPGERRWGN